MKIKVCFITNYAYRLFNQKSRIAFGGIEVIFYLIAKDLVKDRRFSVSFLLEDDVHQRPQTEIIDGITLHKTSRKHPPRTYKDKQIEKYRRWFVCWARKFDRLWQWPHLDFFRLWEKLKQIQADVYIHASPSYESGLITFISKIIKKRSVYLVVNDVSLAKNYQQAKNFKDKIYFFGLKHADIIWCYSSRHQKILKDKYNLEAIYLPCWYPRPKFFLPLKKRKYMLWTGRVESCKHPEAFIKIAKNLPDLKFLMIVTRSLNEPSLFKTIITSATKMPNLKLKQNVMFTDIDRYYQAALAFIDTSDYKNLNMTQVQAAYFKTPCLTLFEDPDDSFKDYHWGLLAKGDFKKMIKNIRAILGQSGLWEKLSKNGYRFADTIYNREANLAIFKQLILKFKK